MDTRVRQLVRVVAQLRRGEQREAVIGRVVGEPGTARKLVRRTHAHHRGVPVNHLLQARGLQVDVVQGGPFDGSAFRYL